MNLKCKLLILAVLLTSSLKLFALIGDVTPSEGYAQCPGEIIEYSFDVHMDYIISAQWTVTNGVFPYRNNSTGIYENTSVMHVRWNQGVTSGTLSLVIIYSQQHANVSVTKTFTIKTIQGVTPVVSGISSTIDVGVEPLDLDVTLNYTRGEDDSDPYRVQDIYFTLPVGWSYGGVVSNGSHVYKKSTQTSYPIYTDDSSGGTFTLWGESDCDNGSNSNVYSLNIVRTIPNFDISLSLGDKLIEGYNTPFTVSAPNWSGVSYSWSVPQTWQYSGSGYSVSVTPDGCNGGTISCTATIGARSNSDSKPITLQLYDPANAPYISGPTTLCSSGTSFSVANLPANYTITWTPPSGSVLSSAQGSNPCVITATDDLQYRVIQAVITSPCNNSATLYKSVWEGLPVIQDFGFDNIYSNLGICCTDRTGNQAQFSDFGYCTSYEYKLTDLDETTIIGQNTSYYNTVPLDYSGMYPDYYLFHARATNACGTMDWYSTEVEFADCSLFESESEMYSLLISPNPVTTETTIQISKKDNTEFDNDLQWDIEIYNQGNILKHVSNKVKNKSEKINTSGWKKGFYIVRARINDDVLSNLMIVK